MNTYMHAYIHMYIHIHACVQEDLHSYIHTHIHETHTHIYIYIYIHTHVCIHMRACLLGVLDRCFEALVEQRSERMKEEGTVRQLQKAICRPIPNQA